MSDASNGGNDWEKDAAGFWQRKNSAAQSSLGGPPGSASEFRFRAMQSAVKNHQLAKAGEMAQITAIARHYMAHAQMAFDLMTIIEQGRYTELDESASGFVRMMAKQIIDGHAHDLGIELEWPNE